MRSNSSCPTTGRTPPSCGFRCGSCAGTWISNTGTTSSLPTPIIGHGSARIYALTPSSRSTSSRLRLSSRARHRLQTCPLRLRTCPITAARACQLSHPTRRPPTLPRRLISSRGLKMDSRRSASNTCPTILFASVYPTRAQVPPHPRLCTIRTSHARQASSRNSTGRCTDSTAAILFRTLRNTASLSASPWAVTPSRAAAPFSKRRVDARRSCRVPPPCSTTYAAAASLPLSADILFIHIVTPARIQRQNFGRSKQTLFFNFA